MKFIDFLVYSQIYVTLGAVSFVYISYKIFNLPFDFASFFVAFSFGFLIYLTNKKGGIKEDEISKLKHVRFIKKYGDTLFFTSILLFLVSLIILFLNGSFWLILMLIFLISLNTLYGVELIPKKASTKVGFSRFKEILFFKNIMSALSWGAAALFPILYYKITMPENVFILMAFLVTRFFINTTFFDVKDVVGDKKCGIRTIPTVYGLKATKKLLSIINVISFIFVLIAVYLGLLPKLMLIINLTTFYAFYYILKIGDKKTDIKFLSDVVADGELILISVLAFIGGLIFP